MAKRIGVPRTEAEQLIHALAHAEFTEAYARCNPSDAGKYPPSDEMAASYARRQIRASRAHKASTYIKRVWVSPGYVRMELSDGRRWFYHYRRAWVRFTYKRVVRHQDE